ncbi:MAG TPA: hypothetical protein VK081_01340 [Planctomycetota bacterium]|nr:hypothetical protein [Planctomycetota bacterium]
MSKNVPDYHDADLVIKLYDLRREPVMRASRDAMNAKFWPRTAEDLLAVTQPDHPLNAAFRQVSSYWEMVYGMARHGIAHAEYLVENNAEGLLLFAKVAPFLDRLRQERLPMAFQHAEWAAKETDVGRQRFETFRKRIEAQLAGR